MISSQAPSIVHAVPRHSKQNAHPSRFCTSGEHTRTQSRARWIALSCLPENGGVSSGTESPLLQTAPDSADAQWVSPADHRHGEAAALGRTLHWGWGSHVLWWMWQERRIPQQSSKADSGFRECFHNSVWSNTALPMKSQWSVPPSTPSCFCCFHTGRGASCQVCALAWQHLERNALQQ